jgi:hypothetical protein
MANGVITFLKRLTAPSAPVTGKASLYIDDSGTIPEAKLLDDDGTIYPFKGVYGSYYVYNQNLNPATNTTTTPQAYVSTAYSGLDPAGIYEVEATITYGYSSGQRDFIGELNISGTGTVTGVVKTIRTEPKDSGADQRFPGISKIVLTGAELGAGTAIFQYYAQQAGDTARMFDGLITITRVA